MEAEGDELRVTVPINELRKQIVTIVFGRRDGNGGEMVTYHSTCGPASERNAMALLRYNTKLLHGAFAVQDVDGRPMVVVQCNQLADTLDAMEVSRALTAIAWQADKVEQKLMGDEDTF